MGYNEFQDPEMQEIFEGYLVETNELLESLSQDLIEIETNADDSELINRIFRGFHTIKGTSAFMGFNVIADITHHAEDILNKLRRNELRVSQAIIDVLFEVQDWIILLINKIQNGEILEVDYSVTIAQIDKLKNQSVSDADGEEELTEVELTQEELTEEELPDFVVSNFEAVISNQNIINTPGDFTSDELVLIEAAFNEVNNEFWENRVVPDVLIDDNDNDNDNDNEEEPFVDLLKAIEGAPFENTQQRTADDINKFIQQPVQKQPIQKDEKQSPKTDGHDSGQNPAKSKANASDTIRVDINRVEALMDLSGELVLGRNRLSQITELIEETSENKDKIRDLIETTSQIDFVTSEIQSAVMRMRMVPIGKLYQKAPRIVRDLSKEFDKKINLIVKGEETEIDRGIIEELNDPLVHMIRNSCDHGIEPQEVRLKAGKPEIGTITLDADQEGNNIVLRISDDGAGMDPEKLKNKAIEKGIITPEQAAQMTSREAYQLIFAPGFSTAAKVTAVSGRGVGMDVVRTNITKLKGLIDIESELGKGSTFIIKLPLTLAIIQGLLVKVQDETYALPLSSVIEVVAIDMKSINSVNKQEVIRIRTEVIPIIRLGNALGLQARDGRLDNRYVVNVGLGLQRVGLVVDELLGQQEIVIKSLGEYLGSITAIAGSTILGDGRVIMIVDVADLIQEIFKDDFI